jgi:hypothetical protein
MSNDDVKIKAFPLRLSPALYEALQAIAKDHARSMNAEIGDILAQAVPAHFMGSSDAKRLLQKEGETETEWATRLTMNCIVMSTGEAGILNGWADKQLAQTLLLSELQTAKISGDQKYVLKLLGDLKKNEEWIRKRNKQLMLCRHQMTEAIEALENCLLLKKDV